MTSSWFDVSEKKLPSKFILLTADENLYFAYIPYDADLSYSNNSNYLF